MIVIQVKNDPNNGAEWICFLHVLLLNDCACVCMSASNKEACTHATRWVSESSRRSERYNIQRRVSILVLPHAGEIDGCIQDFYTPLIGFTGH